MTTNKKNLDIPNTLLNHYPDELLEIEALLDEIHADSRHPVNNHRHPKHAQHIDAYNKLTAMANTLRIEWLRSPEPKKHHPQHNT